MFYHCFFRKFNFFLPSLIILMNFINTPFPFFSFAFFPNSLYTQTYVNQVIPEPITAIRNILTPYQPQVQVKAEQNLQRQNKEVLIKKLKEFHQEEIHRKKTHWSEQEDKLLERLVQIQKLQWRQIPAFFRERTQNMCYSRYRRISLGIKERMWSQEQDENVLKLVKVHGEKWKLLSKKMPKFTAKQIRERYLNYLRPNINKEDFTFQEDLQICQYVMSHGKHWRKMEFLLEGRSEGAIKGRYYGKLQSLIEASFGEQRF